jgi:hypothetical protein
MRERVLRIKEQELEEDARDEKRRHLEKTLDYFYGSENVPSERPLLLKIGVVM